MTFENINNPLFIIPALTGIIFIISGFIMLKFPPKKINAIYGYRTPSSMKSQERWDFAQAYSSVLMIKTGFFLSMSAFLGIIFHPTGETGMMLGLGLLLLAVILLFTLVEKAIKDRFGKS